MFKYYIDISPTKNEFFEIYEVKIWFQPHEKYGAGWMEGWMGGWMGEWPVGGWVIEPV